jgi:hypothetical protein
MGCVAPGEKNKIKYSLKHNFFIKYFINLQLSATCFGFLKPSSG